MDTAVLPPPPFPIQPISSSISAPTLSQNKFLIDWKSIVGNGTLPKDFVEQDEVVLTKGDGSKMIRRTLIPDKVYTLSNFLSDEQCTEWLELANSKGWFRANIRDGKARNNKKCQIFSKHLASKLWEECHLKKAMPEILPTKQKSVGLHQKINLFSYGEGEYFLPHLDGGSKRNQEYPNIDENVSEFTLVVYLNDDFIGGSTRLLQIPEWDYKPREIAPKKGDALIFRQRDVIHEGVMLEKGVKNIIQCSVMYTCGEDKYRGAPVFQLVMIGDEDIEEY